MKRIILTAGAALLVTVPAAIGLVGNTSFAQSVPVRVPPRATLVDDTGAEHRADPNDTRTTEPGDDASGQSSQSPRSSPSVAEPGDDKGGRRSLGTVSPTDDPGGRQAAIAAGPSVRTAGDSRSGGGGNDGHGTSSGQGPNSGRSGGKDDGPAHP